MKIDIHAEGASAFQNGAKLSDNPYRRTAQKNRLMKAEAWSAGWKQARRAERGKRFIELKRQHLTHQQIGDIEGISRQRVSLILIEAYRREVAG